MIAADTRRSLATPGTTLALVALLALAYGATLLPGVGYSGDTAKFQFLGHVLGTPHTSGYPLYVVLNHLFVTLVPVGTLAYKANMLSAVFAIGAAVVLRHLLTRLGVSPWIAFVAALVWGLTPTVWSQAIVAEVYTLHVLFVAGTLDRFLRWGQTRRDRDLYVASALYALSFGNHLTMVTLLPAIALYVALVDRRVYTDIKRVAAIAAIAAAGALPYAFIFWRTYDPTTAYLEMATPDLATFWWYITGAQFKSSLFAFPLSYVLLNRVPWYGKLLLSEFAFVLPALGLFGLRRLTVAQHALLMTAFAGSALFAINYDIVDIQAYFIPSFLIAAVYVALGLDTIAGALPARARRLALPALLLLPVALAALHGPHVSQRDNVETARHVEQALARLGGDTVIVAADYMVYEALMYYMLAEGWREKQLYATIHATPAELARYARDGQPLPLIEERKATPRGLRLAAIDPQSRALLEAAGLRVRAIGPSVWLAAP